MTQSDNHERLKRFAELVSAYGARPEAWPEAERARARALMRASPAARRLLAEAAEVDGWLDRLAVPPVSAGLEQRILSTAPAFGRDAGREDAGRPGLAAMLWRLRGRLAAGPPGLPVRRTACAVAAAAVAGVLLGWGGVFSPVPPVGEEEEIVAMAFVGGGLERYDLGEWQ
ncbi:MAG: hypothetical protein ACLFWF_02820 [Alphaproteobacteria bacterium]